jgi:hypothetical protein
VIAGFTPDMLAPAELAVLTSASRRDQQPGAEEAAEVDSVRRGFVMQG